MELQQRHSVSVNVYDNSEEPSRTEDIYESLKDPSNPPKFPRAASDHPRGRKITFLLLLIIALLTVLVFLMGFHYFHLRKEGVEKATSLKTDQPKDVWCLYSNVFYLFWNDHGDCETAERFCAKRNASIATVTERNMDWVRSQTKGKLLLVWKDEFDGSGHTEDSPLWDDKPECELLDGEVHKQPEGWVCERRAQ